jgi:hypothetical protein
MTRVDPGSAVLAQGLTPSRLVAAGRKGMESSMAFPLAG